VFRAVDAGLDPNRFRDRAFAEALLAAEYDQRPDANPTLVVYRLKSLSP
jgi:hypothetical protein